jgi:hypothetical protein
MKLSDEIASRGLNNMLNEVQFGIEYQLNGEKLKTVWKNNKRHDWVTIKIKNKKWFLLDGRSVIKA